MVASLVNTERRMLKAMLAKPDHTWSLDDILAYCDWQDQAVAAGAGQGLADKKLVRIIESTTTEVRLGKNGLLAFDNGLLEARLWDWYNSTDNPTMSGLQSSFEKFEAGPKFAGPEYSFHGHGAHDFALDEHTLLMRFHRSDVHEY